MGPLRSVKVIFILVSYSPSRVTCVLSPQHTVSNTPTLHSKHGHNTRLCISGKKNSQQNPIHIFSHFRCVEIRTEVADTCLQKRSSAGQLNQTVGSLSRQSPALLLQLHLLYSELQPSQGYLCSGA